MNSYLSVKEKIIEKTILLTEIEVDGYEKVIVVSDETVGLKGIICIHNTTLGPALGGIRIRPYKSFEEALEDVKRLASGMTYKSALSKTGLGGGKSVILCDPQYKTEALLIQFAKAINSLEGLYIGAEDSGSSVEDITLMSQYTPYLVGIEHEKGSGNPSPFTAWGTLRGIQSTFKALDNSTSLEGKKIAIQGLGSVGKILAEMLFWHGAHLIVADIELPLARQIGKKYGALVCSPTDILTVPCDLLAPCALGGVLNSQSIPLLSCRAIAGCANNQLLCSEDADALKARGILYAPDFVVNSGGLRNVRLEIELEGYNSLVSIKQTNQIAEQLMEIFEIAKQKNCSTHQAAVSLADACIRNEIGKRLSPPYYHHYSNAMK